MAHIREGSHLIAGACHVSRVVFASLLAHCHFLLRCIVIQSSRPNFSMRASAWWVHRFIQSTQGSSPSSLSKCAGTVSSTPGELSISDPELSELLSVGCDVGDCVCDGEGGGIGRVG